MEAEHPIPELHAVALSGFGAQADAYDRARPSYPPEAVAWLIAKLHIGPGRRVADLAAGTGKLSVLLAPAGANLVAVTSQGREPWRPPRACMERAGAHRRLG